MGQSLANWMSFTNIFSPIKVSLVIRKKFVATYQAWATEVLSSCRKAIQLLRFRAVTGVKLTSNGLQIT